MENNVKLLRWLKGKYYEIKEKLLNYLLKKAQSSTIRFFSTKQNLYTKSVEEINIF